jgi:DNA-binding transcriptional LysR family regulator
VAEGRLRTILKAFEPEPLPVHLVYAAQSLQPLKLRAFLDFAAPRLKASLLDGAAFPGALKHGAQMRPFQ